MKIYFLQDKTDKLFVDIYSLLEEGDREFFPPLSCRSSTTQKNLTGIHKSVDGIKNYFEEMKKQNILVAVEDDKLLGFVSFKENLVTDVIPEKESPNIYISTLIVSPDARGMGLTRKMYEYLFDTYKQSNVFTRTWSTNTAHINILSKFGFDIYKTIENDRAEGVHTVYFKKGK